LLENDETAYRTSNTKLFSGKSASFRLNNDDSRLKSLEIEPYMLSYEPEELAVIVSAREWMGVEGLNLLPSRYTANPRRPLFRVIPPGDTTCPRPAFLARRSASSMFGLKGIGW
jgi:hypothetical protein